MKTKSGVLAAASFAILAMSTMTTTSANAFRLVDQYCVAGQWGCSAPLTSPDARGRKAHGTTPGAANHSPAYMNNTDPRFNDAMVNAGGGGGGGGGGGR